MGNPRCGQTEVITLLLFVDCVQRENGVDGKEDDHRHRARASEPDLGLISCDAREFLI
jgi:hypothetical protein